MALIQAGLLNQLRDDLGYDLHYDGAVHNYEDKMPPTDPDHRGMKKPRAVSAVNETLSSQVYEHAREGRLVLTLGGDHSIAIGSISGSAKATRERLGRDIAIIWVDAHADINIPEMSPSGNIHGMPMAFLTRLAREEQKDIFGWLQDEHIVSTRKVVYIGLRDVDRGEKQILREHGIKAFSMHDVDRLVPQFSSPPPFLFTARRGSKPKRVVNLIRQSQIWNRTRGRNGPGSRWKRHPHPPVLRRRRAGPAVGAQHWNSSPRGPDAPRGRLHL